MICKNEGEKNKNKKKPTNKCSLRVENCSFGKKKEKREDTNRKIIKNGN